MTILRKVLVIALGSGLCALSLDVRAMKRLREGYEEGDPRPEKKQKHLAREEEDALLAMLEHANTEKKKQEIISINHQNAKKFEQFQADADKNNNNNNNPVISKKRRAEDLLSGDGEPSSKKIKKEKNDSTDLLPEWARALDDDYFKKFIESSEWMLHKKLFPRGLEEKKKFKKYCDSGTKNIVMSDEKSIESSFEESDDFSEEQEAAFWGQKTEKVILLEKHNESAAEMIEMIEMIERHFSFLNMADLSMAENFQVAINMEKDVTSIMEILDTYGIDFSGEQNVDPLTVTYTALSEEKFKLAVKIVAIREKIAALLKMVYEKKGSDHILNLLNKVLIKVGGQPVHFRIDTNNHSMDEVIESFGNMVIERK